MLNGNNIYLRPWRDDDLPILTALRNDVAMQAQLLARARGSRPEEVREWLQSRSGHADRQLFIISERNNEEAQGFIQVSNIDSLDGHAELGICLLDKVRGRGFGGEAIALLADYLRDQWRLRKLSIQVRADNIAALRCYEKAGFQHCGLLHQHTFIEGRWQDVVLMEHFLVGVN